MKIVSEKVKPKFKKQRRVKDETSNFFLGCREIVVMLEKDIDRSQIIQDDDKY